MTDAESLVRRDDHERWVMLTLNRPEKLNALTVDMFAELRAHVEDLRSDDTVDCVILRGAGKCFSAGHDLNDISAGEKVPSRGWHSETLRMLEKLPKPVVAAVHGHCYTGALEVALAADFIVASEDARFGDTHAKWALTPVWGMSQRLPRRVGAATAKRLMFTAAMFGADEAVRIGLAEYAVPAAEFDQHLSDLAEQIVANSVFSHAANKQLIDHTDGGQLDAGLQYEVMESPGRGPDHQERIAAFANKSK